MCPFMVHRNLADNRLLVSYLKEQEGMDPGYQLAVLSPTTASPTVHGPPLPTRTAEVGLCTTEEEDIELIGKA